jgi:hypothetical protein
MVSRVDESAALEPTMMWHAHRLVISRGAKKLVIWLQTVIMTNGATRNGSQYQHITVTPPKEGSRSRRRALCRPWIPKFAGMTLINANSSRIPDSFWIRLQG